MSYGFDSRRLHHISGQRRQLDRCGDIQEGRRCSTNLPAIGKEREAHNQHGEWDCVTVRLSECSTPIGDGYGSPPRQLELQSRG